MSAVHPAMARSLSELLHLSQLSGRFCAPAQTASTPTRTSASRGSQFFPVLMDETAVRESVYSGSLLEEILTYRTPRIGGTFTLLSSGRTVARERNCGRCGAAESRTCFNRPPC